MKPINKSKNEDFSNINVNSDVNIFKDTDKDILELENIKTTKSNRSKPKKKEKIVIANEDIAKAEYSEYKEEKKKNNEEDNRKNLKDSKEEIKKLYQQEQVYISKINELESNVSLLQEENKLLKETKSKLEDEKGKEIKDKDKKLNLITIANSKLMQTLEDLRKQVDQQFEKVNLKKVTDKMKNSTEEKNQNSSENILKVKEKELKNSNQLIEILRKDNEKLQKTVENYTDYKNIFKMQDKLTFKEKEIYDLQLEIKALNKTIEEHKKCLTVKSQLLNEIKILKDDMKVFKENNKELNFKIKDEERRHDKIRENYLSLRKEIENRKIEIVVDHLASPNSNLNQNELIKISSLNHDSNIPGIINSNNNEMKTIKTKNKLTNLTKKKNQNEEAKNLFIENKDELEKVLSVDEINKMERKFEAIENSKNSLENKYKSDVKILNKKMNQLEEKLEYVKLKFKESEQKNKIMQFQVNEYKSEQRVYQKKLNETQTAVEHITNSLREKDQENKILLKQIESMRKIIKHNSLPPMDENLAKHLNDIKNEEMEDEYQRSEENDPNVNLDAESSLNASIPDQEDNQANEDSIDE